MNTHLFDSMIDLFDGIVFQERISFPTFDITISNPALYTQYFNFILPTVPIEKFDWQSASLQRDIFEKRGTPLHFYIQKEQQSAYYEKFLSEQAPIEEEVLVFGNVSDISINSSNSVTLEVLRTETVPEFGRIADICFPTYLNNTQYIAGFHSLDTQRLTNKKQMNTFLVVENQRVGIGQVLYSLTSKVAYFHNFAILPEFRRNGYFSTHKYLLMDSLAKEGITTFFSINAANGESHRANSKLGWKIYDTLIYV